jgi:hypothetical protein
MSRDDLGQVLEPFVFLDALQNGPRAVRGLSNAPNSGIARPTMTNIKASF